MDLLCSWFFIKIITHYTLQWTPHPPSSIFCYSLRTLKFISDHIRAVNPEGPLVPWTMLSSLQPKHRWDLKTLGATLLLSARASCHKQFPPQDDSKIKSLLVFAEPFHECPPDTRLWPPIHLWNSRITIIDALFVGNLRGCRWNLQESAVSMTF